MGYIHTLLHKSEAVSGYEITSSMPQSPSICQFGDNYLLLDTKTLEVRYIAICRQKKTRLGSAFHKPCLAHSGGAWVFQLCKGFFMSHLKQMTYTLRRGSPFCLELSTDSEQAPTHNKHKGSIVIVQNYIWGILLLQCYW